MKKYRIAYFTTERNCALMLDMFKGFADYIQTHPGVTVCSFDCFGKADFSAVDQGEYSIFDLPDLSTFDGILYQGSQIASREVEEKMVRRMRESGLPVVVTEEYIEGFSFYGTDNRTALSQVIEHIIVEHQVKSLCFLSGPSASFEARERKKAYLNLCEKYDIPPFVIPGSWDARDGRAAARQLLEQAVLPGALICANDEMAIGACEVFREAGVVIPQDIIVTGFDHTDAARLHSPQLTTVERSYSSLSYHALAKLIALIDGESLPLLTFDVARPIFSASCGCRQEDCTTPELVQELFFTSTRFLGEYYASQGVLANQLFEAKGIGDIAALLDAHLRRLCAEGVYVCINENYAENYKKSQWMRVREYDDTMVLFSGAERVTHTDSAHKHPRFPKSALLPEELMAQETLLTFYPLHYRDFVVGYVALSNYLPPTPLNLENTFSMVGIAMENIRKRAVLQDMNTVLDNLYVKDSLTGLYNRFGLERFGVYIYESLLSQDKTVRILFADLDGMKRINDTLGHEKGDQAISAAANVLIRSCEKDDFIMRYGGDEFVVVGEWSSSDLPRRIQDYTQVYNKTAKDGFTLSISVGELAVNRKDGWSLEECVLQADKLMYQEKTAKKAARR